MPQQKQHIFYGLAFSYICSESIDNKYDDPMARMYWGRSCERTIVDEDNNYIIRGRLSRRAMSVVFISMVYCHVAVYF